MIDFKVVGYRNDKNQKDRNWKILYSLQINL